MPAWVMLTACNAGTVAGPPSDATCHAAITVNLPVGATQVLSPMQAACFYVAPHADARYALAGFDSRAVEAARRDFEGGVDGDPVYLLSGGSSAEPVVLPSPPATRTRA